MHTAAGARATPATAGWLALLLAALASAVFAYQTMALGPGVTPDSVIYLDTARSLWAGQGFMALGQPMTHYPPLYPLLLLAGAGFTQGDVLTAARWLHAGLFGLNILLAALAVRAATRRSWVPALCAVAVLLFCSAWLDIHVMLWSEPPFIALMLLALLALSSALEQRDDRQLYLAAGWVGLAVACRYLGVTLIPVLLLAVWSRRELPAARRLRQAVAAGCIAILPLAVWVLRNKLAAHTATNRQFNPHVVTLEQLRDIRRTFQHFVLPADSLAGLLLGAAAIAVLAYLLLHRRRLAGQGVLAAPLPWLCGAFAACYMVMLLVSVSFFDAATPLDGRILAPVFVALCIAVLSLVWRAAQSLGSRAVQVAVVAASLLLASAHAGELARRAHTIASAGTGFEAPVWDLLPALAWVKAVPADMVLYSNADDLIYFRTGRPTRPFPVQTNPYTLAANDQVEEQLLAMAGEVARGRAAVIYIDQSGRWYYPPQADVDKALSPFLREREATHSLYALPDSLRR